MVVVRILVYQLCISGLLFFACPLSGQVTSFINNQGGQATAVHVEYREALHKSQVFIKLRGSDHTIFGGVQIEETGFTFTPMVPFTPGLQYDVYLKDRHLVTFEVPESIPTAYIKGIYPSADTLPENLLKIYLEFSEAMGEGYSEKHMRVTSGADTLTQVFLPLQPELWDSTHTRLTLWLDPGRIKRDLAPNALWGTPLAEGQQYTVHVSSEWKDRLGRSLVSGTSKTFYVDEAERHRPSVSNWSLNIPQLDSKDPLMIDLGKEMDYSLLQECIRVFQAENEISVSIEISHQESRVYLHPDEKWQAGTYHLRVASRLEDLAGNNLNRLFDRDIIIDKELPDDRPHHMLTFNIQ